MTQACLDGISDTLAGMQTTTTPYTAGTESLATSGAGELQRLRYVLERVFGWANWYRHDLNIDFGGIGVTKTEVQGAGLGAHVTAVGYHAWSGWRTGTSIPPLFPAFTSTADHWTGISFPARGHLSIVIGDIVNEGGGVKGGVELIRFHAAGLTLHHTAAIRFFHSEGLMHGGQRGHITALSVSRGLASAAGNEAPGQDTLIVGHAGASLELAGAGLQFNVPHITVGRSGSYLALARHVGTLSPATPVKNALYADTVVKGWVHFDGTAAGAPVLASFNVASVTDNGTGDYTIAWDQDFSGTNYAVVCTAYFTIATSTRACMTESATARSASVVRVTVYTTAPAAADPTELSLIAIGSQ